MREENLVLLFMVVDMAKAAARLILTKPPLGFIAFALVTAVPVCTVISIVRLFH